MEAPVLAPAPKIDSLRFKGDDDATDGLEKKPNKRNKVTIIGQHLTLGDIVVVVGTSGALWVGVIDQVGGTFRCKNLRCIKISKGLSEATDSEKEDGKFPIQGPENVSTTVVNPSNGPSNTLSQNVPIIP